MNTKTAEQRLSVDEQAFKYAKANGITCTVDQSVVRSGAWRVKIPDHAYPTVLDRDDAQMFANYIEIVNRTTLVDAAKHFLPRIETLETENANLRALVQVLVDDLRKLRIEFGNRTGTTTQIGIVSLRRSDEAGFVPTNTEDNG